MVAAITETCQRMELLALGGGPVNQPVSQSFPPSATSRLAFDSMGSSGSGIGNGSATSQHAETKERGGESVAAALPRYQFKSSPSTVPAGHHPGGGHVGGRRPPSQSSALRSRSHALSRPGAPGTRVWMVKCRQKAFGLGLSDPKNDWSPDTICWKPICKWAARPMSLSADEAHFRSLHQSESDQSPRRPKSQPCLLPTSFGKRSHEEIESPRPYLNFAKMKKSCSYSGLEASPEDEFVKFNLTPPDSKPLAFDPPANWGKDLDVGAIECDS